MLGRALKLYEPATEELNLKASCENDIFCSEIPCTSDLIVATPVLDAVYGLSDIVNFKSAFPIPFVLSAEIQLSLVIDQPASSVQLSLTVVTGTLMGFNFVIDDLSVLNMKPSCFTIIFFLSLLYDCGAEACIVEHFVGNLLNQQRRHCINAGAGFFKAFYPAKAEHVFGK